MKKKMLWLVCMCCLVGYLLFGVRGLAFNQSKFKVQIVPLNCQFDVIDAGTNEIKYLTPVECGEAPSPQSPTDGSSGGTIGNDDAVEDTGPLSVDTPQATGQDPDSSGHDTPEQIAPHLRDRGSAEPRTTQDVVILAGLVLVAGLATDILLFNGWIGQRLAQRWPFLRRRG